MWLYLMLCRELSERLPMLTFLALHELMRPPIIAEERVQ